ncbi:MAG: sigma-70 family RNA polymerase sigma factor [Actinomycetota bacterium]|nr:sigma-70 family RNA polymerase sigma factor [Actinomycetota bacterium]
MDVRCAEVEGRPLEEAELVERARQGDVGAYEELVRRYQHVAARTAYLVTRLAAEAEDAVQEAFVKAYYALPRFRGDAPFRPWLLAIVANEARNRRKSAARRARLALRAGQDRPSGDAAPSPEVAALAEEERTILVAAMNRLKEHDRMVIGYRYFLGLSERETAVALGVPAGTVKSRLARALRRLRKILEASSAEPLAAQEGGRGG